MNTDERLRAALGDVAADTTDVTDDELWTAITAEAASPSSDRGWRRPALLAVASVAVVALVVGVISRGDDGDRDSQLDVLDDPSTTVENPEPDPSVTSPTTGTSVPGPGSRPMVVVNDDGNRVTAYFSDGRDPIVYEPTFSVGHAEISPDGTLWLTSAASCPGCTPVEDTRLINIDPTTGEQIAAIDGAGYAAVSPDGTRLAYVDYAAAPDTVIITSLDPSGDDQQERPSHDPDGPVENFLWALGQIQWSPDGTRLLVNEFWEDDIVWLVDLESDAHVSEGTALSLRGADWISDDRLLGTQYCCYAEPDQEPRHLVEVDLSGDEPVIIDRDELSAGIVGVAPGGLGTAVHVVGDDFATGGPLVRIATGEVIAEGVISIQW